MKRLEDFRIIGRVDRIDLPALGIYDLEAKVDTGARTCALHALRIEQVTREGKPCIRFFLRHHKHPEMGEMPFELPSLGTKRIKSSNGHTEKRYLVETEVVLFGETFLTRFSLTDRNEMDYPVLLGRRLLSGRFLVDVTEVNCSYLLKYPDRSRKKAKS